MYVLFPMTSVAVTARRCGGGGAPELLSGCIAGPAQLRPLATNSEQSTCTRQRGIYIFYYFYKGFDVNMKIMPETNSKVLLFNLKKKIRKKVSRLFFHI